MTEQCRDLAEYPGTCSDPNPDDSLSTNELSPTVIPGPIGGPARETTDPVDILNSVTVEGWKLVSGKFLHSEMRNGAVGCYLFKRSQKRRLTMNHPWQDPSSIIR